MDKEKISRTVKRKEKIHEEILQVAANLIREHGSSGVTFEQIALSADVARKTIYNHFDNKESLLRELVMPLCNHARNYLETVSKSSELSLDHLWDYCLELWNEESIHVSLLYKVSQDDCSDMNDYIHGFIYVFKTLLKGVPKYHDASEEHLRRMAFTIYQTYIPLLQSLENVSGYEILFKRCMSGLLKGFDDPLLS